MSESFIPVSEIQFNDAIYEIQPPVNVPESMYRDLTMSLLVGFALANFRNSDPGSVGYTSFVISAASVIEGPLRLGFPEAALSVAKDSFEKAGHSLTQKT